VDLSREGDLYALTGLIVFGEMGSVENHSCMIGVIVVAIEQMIAAKEKSLFSRMSVERFWKSNFKCLKTI